MHLDHVIVAVADLEAAAARYEALLGLPVAVRSEHRRGTKNALFLFPRGPYLELLALRETPEQGTSAAALARRLAEHGEGLHGVAFAPADLDGFVRRLRGQRLDIMDPIANSGTGPGGRERQWRAVIAPPPDSPTVFFLEHLGWDWRTQLRPEPLPGRGRTVARGIHHVAWDVPDAYAASDRWQERYGLPRAALVESTQLDARVIVHDAGDASFEFVEATRADGRVAARIARQGHGLSGLAFAVDDLEASVAAARAADINAGDPEPGVLPGTRIVRIDPASVCGVAAQFIQTRPA